MPHRTREKRLTWGRVGVNEEIRMSRGESIEPVYVSRKCPGKSARNSRRPATTILMYPLPIQPGLSGAQVRLLSWRGER